MIITELHVGIRGNEEADKRARNAAEAGITTTQEHFFSKTDAKILVKQHCMQLWQDYYTGSSKGSHYKILQPSVWQSLPVSSNRVETSLCHETTFLFLCHNLLISMHCS